MQVMRTLKLQLMFFAVGVLGVAGFAAFRAAVQLKTRRETSEVIRLLSDREVVGFQILWSVVGLASVAFAVFLLVRVWRIVFAERNERSRHA